METIQERLAELDADALSWSEIHRQTLAQFYGEDSVEEVRKSFGDKIPLEGVGDAFTYRLDGMKGLHVRYSQTIFSTRPFRNIQRLSFYSGESAQPSNPLAGVVGFQGSGLSDAKLRFVMGRFEDKEHVELESQNLMLHERDTIENEFTEQGRGAVETIIAKGRRLVEIAGLRLEDKQTLERLISNTRSQFEAGNLRPYDWQY